MVPVIAIVGRPNVGKSTLFNQITKRRDAIVADMPGVTRDRQYGEAIHDGVPFILIDTGGIEEEDDGIRGKMIAQSWQAVAEADLVLFLVDGRAGINSEDAQIAKLLRQQHKKTILVVNKTDGVDPEVARGEFFELGFADVVAIAASHNRGVQSLLSYVVPMLPQQDQHEFEDDRDTIRVAIVGRPNVGKSTLVNRILGEERQVVFNQAGTTRDSIYIPYQRGEQKYVFIDTAGVKRRAKVTEAVEKFSVIKSLQAIEASRVVVLVFDAREGLLDQDLRLIDFVLDAGRALVIAINKWDGISNEQRHVITEMIEMKLNFVNFVEIHKISALHGTGVGKLFTAINTSFKNACAKFSTNKLTKILEDAVQQHPPPMVHGRRIKLRVAHMGGNFPPTLVIHGNQTQDLPQTYQRYLTNIYRKVLKLTGTPMRLILKTGENPFEGKKNPLTDRQIRRRKRLKDHTKRS